MDEEDGEEDEDERGEVEELGDGESVEGDFRSSAKKEGGSERRWDLTEGRGLGWRRPKGVRLEESSETEGLASPDLSDFLSICCCFWR